MVSTRPTYFGAFVVLLSTLIWTSEALSNSDTTLRDLIALIDREIANAQQVSSGPPYIRIDNVRLTLALTNAQTQTGGLNLKIPIVESELSVGLASRSATTDTISLYFDVPPYVQTTAQVDLGLQKAIADLRAAIAAALQDASTITPTTATYERRFYLKKDSNNNIRIVIPEVGSSEESISENKIWFSFSIDS